MRLVAVGTLTTAQVDAINQERAAATARWTSEAPRYPPIVAEVVFMAATSAKAVFVRDGYTIDDVVEQIASAMDSAAVVLKSRFPR